MQNKSHNKITLPARRPLHMQYASRSPVGQGRACWRAQPSRHPLQVQMSEGDSTQPVQQRSLPQGRFCCGLPTATGGGL